MQQGILQSAIRMTNRRMNDQAGWFVDHDQVVVRMDDIQRNVLRDDRTLPFSLCVQHQLAHCR